MKQKFQTVLSKFKEGKERLIAKVEAVNNQPKSSKTSTSNEVELNVELKKQIIRNAIKDAEKNDGILTFPDGVGNVIPDCAFMGNTFIRKVVIPKSIEKIGIGAFSGCYNLEEVTLQAEKLFISDEAFKETNVLKIVVKDAYIGKSAFENSNIRTFQTNGNCIFEDYAFANSEIEKVICKGGIISIGEGCFYNCKNLVDFCCTKNLESIGREAFAECTSLEKIAFLEKSLVTSLEKKTFYKCVNLEEIRLCKITGVGESCFEGCKKLGVNDPNLFPERIRNIGKAAFKGCSGIEVMNLEQCKVIETEAFYGCVKLKYVSMDLIETIKDSAFAYSAIEKLYCTNIALIGTNTFRECYNLKSVYFGKNVTKIGKSCFKGAKKLTDVGIESSKLTEIPDNIFESCTELKCVQFNAEKIAKIGRCAFRECISLYSINEFKEVTQILEQSFYRCSMLNAFNFYKVEYIGERAFEGTAISEVCLKETTANIGNNAFANCQNLKKVTIKSGSNFGANAFETMAETEIKIK